MLRLECKTMKSGNIGWEHTPHDDRDLSHTIGSRAGITG